MGGHGNKQEGNTVLDLDYADDVSVLDENVGKVNEFLEISGNLDMRICLKINFKIN